MPFCKTEKKKRLVTGFFGRASEFSLYLGGNRLNANEEGSLTIDVPGEAAEIHPFYNPVNLNNDLALIRLPEPVFFNGNLLLSCFVRLRLNFGGFNRTHSANSSTSTW